MNKLPHINFGIDGDAIASLTNCRFPVFLSIRESPNKSKKKNACESLLQIIDFLNPCLKIYHVITVNLS